MKLLSVLIIIAGTIGASVTAAHIPPLWPEFSISLIIAAIGIYLHRKKAGDLGKGETSSDDSLTQFKRLIDEQLELIARVIKSDNVQQELLSNGQIENLYNSVEDIRVDLINQLGMKKYISIISPFAQAERLLYRGYSSAMDGYEDEAKRSVSESSDFFILTKEEINQLTQSN